ncbi:MAG: hypothetical protein ACOH1M_05090 [Rhodoglobus sp.]
MNTRQSLGIVIAGALAVSMLTAAPAFADEASGPGGEGVTVEEVSSALDNLGEGLLKESVSTQPDTMSRGSEDQLIVEVPTNAREGVSMTAGDFSLGISLPNASKSELAGPLDNGAVAYPSTGASSNVVVPTDGGVQLLSIIDSEKASESYSYDLTMPVGNTLEATADGGAEVVDAQGDTTVFFEPAWARDANDKAVPTRYVVEGNTLIQIVSHKGLTDVAYPVVADPVPVIVLVLTTIAMVAVAVAVLGVATYIVLGWWNTCRAMGKYPELSTKNGFTARCVR